MDFRLKLTGIFGIFSYYNRKTLTHHGGEYIIGAFCQWGCDNFSYGGNMKSLRGILYLLAYVILVSGIISCGGGGGSTASTPTKMTVSGIASKGRINGGMVTVYKLNADGSTGSSLGTGTTDATGAYSITINQNTGNMKVQVAGGTYTDEATGNTVENYTLNAAKTNVSRSTTINVTALTEVAVQKAGTLTTTNVNAANAAVSTIAGTGIIATTPADVAGSSTGTQAQKDYGLALAAISQMASDNSSTATAVISQIAADLAADNMLDTTGTSLSTALTNFIGSANNQSGVTSATTTLDETITTYTSTQIPIDTTAPGIPSGLTATASSSTLIYLSWTAATDDTSVMGYNIYRDGSVTSLKNVTGTSTSDTGLTASTQYCYTVSAYDAAGNESLESTQDCDTTQASASVNLTSGLVAYYPFNGNANDESGNGNDGTVNGATLATDRFGNSNSAYSFDASSSQYIDVANDLTNFADFTYSLWIDINSLSGYLMQTGNGVISYDISTKRLSGGISGDRIGGTGSGASTRYTYSYVDSSIEDNWVHVVFVGKSDNSGLMYIDGTEVSTTYTPDSGVTSDTIDTVIGAKYNTNGSTRSAFYNGVIDDIRIYDRALSTVEVQALYNDVPDTWTTNTSMPTARYSLASSVVNGKIYAIGGIDLSNYFTIVEEYDPATDTWTTKTSMPTARRYLTSSVVNGRIYVIGGIGGSATVEEYDPASDTWTTKTSMPTARNGLTSSVANGRIYVIGGIGGTATVEEYDPASDTWTTKTSMPTARRYLTSSVVNGKIYTIGGTDESNRLTTVEEYDPASDTWTTKTSMPTARSWLTSSEVNGKIYVIGGWDGSTLATVEEYTP